MCAMTLCNQFLAVILDLRLLHHAKSCMCSDKIIRQLLKRLTQKYELAVLVLPNLIWCFDFFAFRLK